MQKAIGKKIGRYSHTSSKVVLRDILPSFRYIFKVDHEFGVQMSIGLDFTKEEISWLLDEKMASNKVKYLLTEIKDTLEHGGKSHVNGKTVEIFTAKKTKDEEVKPKKGKAEAKESDKSSERESEPEKDENKKDEKKEQKNLFDY
jgi:hypothetical protein